MKTVYIVRAFWDAEAKVWCAEGTNFIGLATSGKNIDEVMQKVRIMIPELLEATEEMDGHREDDIPVQLLVETATIAHKNSCA